MFDRMSPQKLARAKGQSTNTNQLNAIAHVAGGYGGNGQGATGGERRVAEDLLVDLVGARKADRLIKQARKKVRDSF